MLGIDLSALSGAELTRLLEVSRAKRQAEMIAELLREFARRGAQAQPATAVSWTPPPLEAPAKAGRRGARAAAIAAVALAAVAASAGTGWWLTQDPAPKAATPAPSPTTPGSPAPTQAAPPLATQIRPPRRAGRHVRAHRTRHRAPARPHRRHGLMHRLTDWLNPPPRGR